VWRLISGQGGDGFFEFEEERGNGVRATGLENGSQEGGLGGVHHCEEIQKSALRARHSKENMNLELTFCQEEVVELLEISENGRIRKAGTKLGNILVRNHVHAITVGYGLNHNESVWKAGGGGGIYGTNSKKKG